MTNLRSLHDLFRSATKLTAACALASAIATAAYAQTNTFPSSGNAGVGTTSPSGKFQIHVGSGQPDIRLSSEAVAHPFTFGGVLPATLAARIMMGYQDNGGIVAQGFTDADASALRFQGHIGSTAPTQPAVIFEAFKSDGGTDRTTLGASEVAFGFYNGVFDATSPLLQIRGNGNVGIGTGNPNARLVIASGNFGLGTNSLATWTAQTSVIESLDTSIFFGTDTDIGLNSNAYHNAGWKYKTADPAANVHLYKGDIYFRTAAAGVADAPLTWANSMFINSGGNVGIGTTSPTKKLHVAGDIQVDGNINAKYQDLAEWVPSAEQLSPGTVVALDPRRSNQVISSSQPYDTRVAGVISAQPGITLGESGEGKVLVATTGRVRVKVDASRGPIQIGDLLVTSDIPGVAMKSEAVEFAGRKMHMPGTIIGKALEPLAKGGGEILVLLSLQ